MDTGVSMEAVERYVADQIYAMPGVADPRAEFTILLTGSRATGAYGPASDVDIEVLCPHEVFDSVQRAAVEAGLVRTPVETFYVLPQEGWQDYFGADLGRPHFSITPLDDVARQFAEFDDVHLWIWTNALVLRDPENRFGRILARFGGYPLEVLVRKIKYHWMLACYWGIDVTPFHHSTDEELLPAGAALLNAVNEYYRVFFLVEGRPFPYTEKLTRYVGDTALGGRFMPMLTKVVDLVVGLASPDKPPWQRMEEAFTLFFDGDKSPDCVALDETCAEAMRAAGVEPEWVEADYRNIGQLFRGDLGPVP